MGSSVPEGETRISVKEKFCYGVGDISHGLAVSSVGFWFLFYLTEVAGLGALLAGIAIMIGRAWDAVTDPIMGWITDHTHSRWGKRRPYLLFGAIPYAIAFLAMWVVPEYSTEAQIFAYVAFTLILFNTFLTVLFVPYTSLTAAITNDYNERTSLTGYRMASSTFAMLIGASVPVALVSWVTSDSGKTVFADLGIGNWFGTWAGTPRVGYLLMALMFGFFMVAATWTTFFGTKERDATPSGKVDGEKGPAAIPNSGNSPSPLSYASSILDELQGNRPFQISVLILLLTNCATTLIAVNLPYYLEYVLDLGDSKQLIILIMLLSSIAAVPLWVWLAKRYGKAETYRLAMIGYTCVLFSLPFISVDYRQLIYVISVLAGVFYSSGLTLPWAIVPDIVEYDELKTGLRREGLFYGGTTFTYKIATAMAIFFSGSVLELMGYVPNQPQSNLAILGIRLMVGPAAAAMLIAGAHYSTKYPITQQKHTQILEELRRRKAEGLAQQ